MRPWRMILGGVALTMSWTGTATIGVSPAASSTVTGSFGVVVQVVSDKVPETSDLGRDPAAIADLQERLGLGEAAAQLWLDSRTALRRIDFRGLDPAFDDYEIDFQPDLRIRYLTTGDSVAPEVIAGLRDAGISITIEVRHIDHRSAAIEAAMEELAGLDTGAYLVMDAANSSIRATVANLDGGPPGPHEIRGVPVTWQAGTVPHDQVAGGKPWYNCTAGFVVFRMSDLQRGISTAAHCSVILVYEGVAVSYVGGHDGGKYDAKWYSGSATWRNKIRCCGGISLSITWRVAKSAMSVGDPVCHMRYNGTAPCGNITSKSACFNTPAACTYVEYEVPNAGKDSGGPAYFGGGAFGWHVAGDGGSYGLFMPQQYSADYGFLVAIA